MAELVFKLVADASGVKSKLVEVKNAAQAVKDGIEDPAELYVLTSNARGKMVLVKREAEETREAAEKPAEVKINATAALGTIRDLKIALDGVVTAVKGVTAGLNKLLDSELVQRQADTLVGVAFGEMAGEMREFASAMQDLTNYGDEMMLPLFAKMSQMFKLTADEVMDLTPALLDFTEANKATGMTLETAFTLFGRALTGNTALLNRYGVELDATRLEMEGVSYLVEKLNEDYGGTAQALADLRIQNKNTWGDIQEDVGAMLRQIVNPLLKGLQALMKGYQSLSPVMRGFVAGLVIAIPVIATTATAIIALTAAVGALKAMVNPLTALISGMVAVLVVLGVTAAATTMKIDETGEAVQTMDEKIQNAGREVAAEAEKFKLLSNRLLELRSATKLTANEQVELKNIISTMNQEYGEHLGKIDLGTAAYNQLASEIRRVNEALIQKKVAEVYGAEYNAQLKKTANAIVALQRATGTSNIDDAMKEYDKVLGKYNAIVKAKTTVDGMLFMPGAALTKGMRYGSVQKVAAAESGLDKLLPLVAEYEKTTDDLLELEQAFNAAVSNLPSLKLKEESGGGGGGGYTSRVVGNVDEGLREFQRLLAEMENLAPTDSLYAYQKGLDERLQMIEDFTTEELKLHRDEWTKRNELIKKYTEEDSEAQKNAYLAMHAWDIEERFNILKQGREETIKTFEAEISYYENLEALGVDTYTELKDVMTQYYEWAQEQLPAKEQALIEARISQRSADEARKIQEHEEELARVREEFADKDLDLAGRTYDLQILALERYYERRKQTMIAAGITEEEIEEQKAAAIKKINEAKWAETGRGLSSMLGNMMSMLDQSSEREFAIWKGLAYAQAVVDALSATNAAFSSLSAINPILAAAAAAAAFTAGMVNAEKIRKTEFKPMAATGGFLRGPSHAQGGIDIEVEGGEYVAAKDRVRALGRGLFDFLNFAPLEQVKRALSGMPIPTVPLPDQPALAYAGGGMVSGGGLSHLMEAILAKLDKLDKLAAPVIHVEVDPLSNDPVKISQIADRGSKMRSKW